MYRAATFATKREARDWATEIEAQATHISAGGYAPVPKGATLGDLIDKYSEWAAAGFVDTLLRWKMKLEVADGHEKEIQPRVQA